MLHQVCWEAVAYSFTDPPAILSVLEEFMNVGNLITLVLAASLSPYPYRPFSSCNHNLIPSSSPHHTLKELGVPVPPSHPSHTRITTLTLIRALISYCSERLWQPM